MVNLRDAGHILYIASVDLSIGNGPGVNEREFARSLYNEIGHRAHFLIPRPRHDVDDLPDAVCTYSSSHQSHSLRHFPEHVLSTARLANRLLSRRQFDLMVFRLDLLPGALLYITKTHDVPYVIKTLGQGQMKALEENMRYPLGSALAKVNQLAVRELVKDAVVVDTVSQRQRRYLEQALDSDPHKIVCIDNAVNTDRFYPSSRTQARRQTGLERYDPIIGYIGNHAAHERGGTQIINVMPTLISQFPNLGFVILGDMSGNGPLIELAREVGVADRCVFTGYVPFHQVPTYVNALDIGVSLLAPRYTGQSELKVRQYLACGKPVLATVPGSNDFVASEHLGSLVRYDDLSAVSQELTRWLSMSEDERLEFSARAFEYTGSHLSVEHAFDERMSLWQDRLSKRRSQSSVPHGHRPTDRESKTNIGITE